MVRCVIARDERITGAHGPIGLRDAQRRKDIVRRYHLLSTRNGPSTLDNARDDGSAFRRNILTGRERLALRYTERSLFQTRNGDWIRSSPC
jgi:hypothetical protein